MAHLRHKAFVPFSLSLSLSQAFEKPVPFSALSALSLVELVATVQSTRA